MGRCRAVGKRACDELRRAASKRRGSCDRCPREQQVLRLIAAGHANAEIARVLVIAVSTVKTHTNSIFGKLGVTSRTQAIRRARDLHLL